MNVVDCIRANAEREPGHPAIIADARKEGATLRLGYGELVERVDAAARDLSALGVARGDRCGLVAPQGADFITMALAILAAGGCLVPIPDDHAGAVLEEFAGRAHLHHLIVHEATTAYGDDHSNTDGTAPACGDVGRPGSTASGPSEPTLPGWHHHRFANVVPVDGANDEAFRTLDPAYMRFTSGTTSERKGVVIGHRAILERLAAANRGLAIAPADRILWLLPMAHHFVVSILLYLRHGATILLPVSSLAGPVLDLAAREHATVFYASPYHLNLLAKDRSDATLADVRLVISTADGLRAEIARAFTERYGLPVVQALGIIEVGLPVINVTSARTKPEALGRPLPDYRIELRDEAGRTIDHRRTPDAIGEICIDGPGLFDAYLDPWTPAMKLTAETGFRTGDQGRFDADGDLQLVGRRANRINMAGMKFFCEEVEAVLDTHPAIERSRVFAREHAHLGSVPVAEIVVAAGADVPTRKELTALCRERLPGYKIPREFAVVKELEMTVTGKVRRGGT